jgi:sugar O-acyltransferase (sialic acid O-acetyltransferase NeuD family)
MEKTLAIIGAGHLGQQIAHYAITDKHFTNVVFFDDYCVSKEVDGFSVIGNTELIIDSFSKRVFDELIIGIGYNHLKARKHFFELLSPTIPFATIIHSSCLIDITAKIKKGCVLYPGCLIEPNVILDENSILNIGCSISHDSYLGPHSFLSPRVAIAGFVELGEMSILGINATIIDNIKITSNTQLGGGTVVIKSIEISGLYVGNPHRFIR